VDRLEELVEQINGETDHIPDAGNMVGTSPNWEIGEQREIRGQWYECREEATYPSCEDQHGNTCAKAAFCLSGDPTEFPEFSEGDSCEGIVLIAIDPPTGDSPFPDRLRKFAEARRDDYEAMDAEESDTIMALTPEETFRTALATVRYAAGRLARVADELAYSSDDYIADEVASVSRLIVDFQRAAKFFGHAETRKTVNRGRGSTYRTRAALLVVVGGKPGGARAYHVASPGGSYTEVMTWKINLRNGPCA